MAGLQDIAPTVANRCVTSAVRAPVRAAALAASQPAWPPPMTMTSNDSSWAVMPDFYRGITKPGRSKFAASDVSRETAGAGRSAPLFHVKHAKKRMKKEILFPHTKLFEDHIQDILNVDAA